MAELESFTRIESGAPGQVPGRYVWRYALPLRVTIRLGSEPALCDWAVPEDRMVSRFHAVLEWDGEALSVARREPSPDFPTAPRNHIWYRDQPTERFTLHPGESFVIGQTRFTLHGDAAEPEPPVDLAPVEHEAELSREQLEELPFANPAVALRAMERLPEHLKLAATEPALFRQMLKVVLEALPRADAAGVVRVLPNGTVTLTEQNLRAVVEVRPELFTPSRRLSRRAVESRKSCLHVWSAPNNGDPEPTRVAPHLRGVTPWAICTPLHDSSGYALYVSGSAAESGAATVEQLTEYQKVVELLAGILEVTRRTVRLARQNAVLRRAWPAGIHRYLDDPDRLEELLRPVERDVTVLFCDLRNYSGRTEARADDLAQAWREVAAALDVMGDAITERGGVIAGCRGDAVLGFWGWPEPQADQVERAAEAALRIRDKLAGWLIRQNCGVAVTHGRALAGRLGVHDLAVVDLYGPVVNLVFRLEEMTKAFGAGTLVSAEVASRLATSDPENRRWGLRPLGRVRPRGVRGVEAVYELFPVEAGGPWASDTLPATRAEWDDIVARFTSGDWSAARERITSHFPDDPVAKCLLHAMRGRAPANWDGIFTPVLPDADAASGC